MPKFEVFGAKIQEFIVIVDAEDDLDAMAIAEGLDLTEFDFTDVFVETFEANEVREDAA